MMKITNDMYSNYRNYVGSVYYFKPISSFSQGNVIFPVSSVYLKIKHLLTKDNNPIILCSTVIIL